MPLQTESGAAWSEAHEESVKWVGVETFFFGKCLLVAFAVAFGVVIFFVVLNVGLQNFVFVVVCGLDCPALLEHCSCSEFPVQYPNNQTIFKTNLQKRGANMMRGDLQDGGNGLLSAT